MKFFTGLILFIIGSLIVTFIVSPSSFKSVGASINNIIKPTIANVTQRNYITLIPSQMDEYGYYKDLYKSCADLDAMGQSNGIADIKTNTCQEACGKRNMNFGYYSCDRDLLTCFCSS